ncbi:MAG: integrase arm-type DNA-binding domain-containing protein [Acinetobacter sp.]
MSFTDAKIKAVLRELKLNNPNGLQKDVRLSNRDGLNLLIRKSGATMWRFDYTRPITKKRNTLYIGHYPEMTLAKAREFREQYRALILEGKDPQEEKESVGETEKLRKQNTFQEIAEQFKSKEDLSPGTIIRNDRILKKLYLAIADYLLGCSSLRSVFIA